MAKLPIRINIATPFTKFKSSITRIPMIIPSSMPPNSTSKAPNPYPGLNLHPSLSRIDILSFLVVKVRISKELNLPNFSAMSGLLTLKNKSGKRFYHKITTFSNPEAHLQPMFTKIVSSFLAVLSRSKISDPLMTYLC